MNLLNPRITSQATASNKRGHHRIQTLDTSLSFSFASVRLYGFIIPSQATTKVSPHDKSCSPTGASSFYCAFLRQNRTFGCAATDTITTMFCQHLETVCFHITTSKDPSIFVNGTKATFRFRAWGVGNFGAWEERKKHVAITNVDA